MLHYSHQCRFAYNNTLVTLTTSLRKSFQTMTSDDLYVITYNNISKGTKINNSEVYVQKTKVKLFSIILKINYTKKYLWELIN